MSTDLTNASPLFPNRITFGLLLLLLIVCLPLFVCAPVTSDTSLFDVQALTVLRGGVLYQDVIEPNLPGIVWIHLAVRTLAGWSSEAIRIVDLMFFATTIGLLLTILRHAKCHHASKSALLLFVLFSTLFYLTRNEWCHCQRDMWMMIPVAGALRIRLMRQEASALAVVEGVVWGVAFWIKPHIAIPAGTLIAADSLRNLSWKTRTTDLLLVISGGLIAAVPGVFWLIHSGAWEPFWEMMLEWNPEYLATGKTRRSLLRLTQMLHRLHPWWMIHLVAIPIAAINSLRWIRNSASENRALAVLSFCYLAWLVQTFLLQHAMDYIHVPEVILGLAVLTAHPWKLDHNIRRLAVAMTLLLAIAGMPQLHHSRIFAWTRCFTEGSSPELRNLLAQGNFPDWENLNRVQEFLQSEGIRDGQLTCLNVHSVHLHKELKVLPASRYWSVTHPLTMYPSRYDQIMTTVLMRQSRFVVAEDQEMSHPDQILPGDFFHDEQVVFTAGSYTVYAIDDAPQTASGRVQRDSSTQPDLLIPPPVHSSDTTRASFRAEPAPQLSEQQRRLVR